MRYTTRTSLERAKEHSLHDTVENIYQYIDLKFRKIFMMTHVLGVTSYAFSCHLINLMVINKLGHIFEGNTTQRFVIIFGTFCGILWNIQDYAIDRSLKWEKIFKFDELKNAVNLEKIKAYKFSYYVRYNFFHLLALLLICLSYIIILANPHPSINLIEISNVQIFTLTFLITAIFALTAFYFKNITKIHYSQNENSKIYFTLHDLEK